MLLETIETWSILADSPLQTTHTHRHYYYNLPLLSYWHICPEILQVRSGPRSPEGEFCALLKQVVCRSDDPLVAQPTLSQHLKEDTQRHTDINIGA